jgi:aarF domain-containing kinase
MCVGVWVCVWVWVCGCVGVYIRVYIRTFVCIRARTNTPHTHSLSHSFTRIHTHTLSLTQVYKAVLRSTGETVAVKVQRPFVLETVSLDLFLLREAAELVAKLKLGRTDFVALLDEFAPRFYGELDYVNECDNGIKFAQIMQNITQVVVPTPYPALTTRRVHTAQWIEGQKLSQSAAGDVSSLVAVGMIAYLTQLLESGFFHADPHPGNMLRTPDGRLAILDFGLMTQVISLQKYAIVRHRTPS